MNCGENPSEFGQQDIIFLSVKVPALFSVVEGLAPLLGPQTIIVTAMNGIPWWFFKGDPVTDRKIDLSILDTMGKITKNVPTNRLIGCVVHLGAMVSEPGVIQHIADNRLILGDATGILGNQLNKLVSLFDDTLLDVRACPDLRQEVWIKVLGNFNFAPISVLSGATNGQIGKDTGLRKVAVDMFNEAAEAGRKIGLEPGMTAEKRIDLGASLGNFRTSMLQDFDRNRPPEIDAIVAAVIQIGRATKTPMPVSETIFALVSAKARELGLYRFSYLSITLGAKTSSSESFLGVKPCSNEYWVIASNSFWLAMTPCCTSGCAISFSYVPGKRPTSK